MDFATVLIIMLTINGNATVSMQEFTTVTNCNAAKHYIMENATGNIQAAICARK